MQLHKCGVEHNFISEVIDLTFLSSSTESGPHLAESGSSQHVRLHLWMSCRVSSPAD